MLSTSLLLAASMVVGQADGQKVFKAYTDFTIGGTWKTTVDGTDVESTYTRIEGSKFVKITNKGGPLPFVGMIGVDPQSEKCTFWFFNNDGGIGKDVLTQESDGVWLLQGTGMGPEGKVRYKGRITRVADKKGVLDVGVGGETTGISLWGYDAVTKQMWMKNIGSAGIHFELLIWKESPKKWGWEITKGGLPDGKKFGGTGSYIFSDDGKSEVIKGKVTIDGKPTKIPLNDTHVRLDK